MRVKELLLAALSRANHIEDGTPADAREISKARKHFNAALSTYSDSNLVTAFQRVITIEGKECVVIGRSNIVGKPMALLLLRENGTVTVCHSRTKDLKDVTKRADILVVAIGKPKFIDASFVKDGAVVIDVGIHRNEEGKLCGDVDFDSVKDKTSAITPVPGGVGPMTIAMLMNNCVAAVENKTK